MWGKVGAQYPRLSRKIKNKPSSIKSFWSEGKRISDNADIAEKSNNRISSTLADKIKRPEGKHYRQFVHQNIPLSFRFDLIDEKI